MTPDRGLVEVDRACLQFRHCDCPHLEDGPVDEVTGSYELTCCCGIPVDTRTIPLTLTLAAGEEPV